ncbi:response regulator [Rhizobium sp. CFBP 8762]|uniref:response regulator n=1 Tax=Rhizobium sp. CFBP 8762 TaxID=2775279 RepID=UPI001782C7E1|nr:response regulator [Rhizobium sp. CFBP 8762]MBD8554182.1 response regulator [Rhizobium sp. CFBP 8762]
MTLSGLVIMVVEDEYLIALDTVDALVNAGATVVGPFATVSAAQSSLMSGDKVDAAVLDVHLNGDLVFPLADALLAKNIPYIFASGYDSDVFPSQHQANHRLLKPYDPRLLVKLLENEAGRAKTSVF